MAVGGGVVDLDPGDGVGIEDAGFDVAGAVGEGILRGGRAGEAQLLDGHSAFVAELKLDAVVIGFRVDEGNGAGDLGGGWERECQG